MADLYKKRFGEICDQMDSLFSSKRNVYIEFLGKNREDIESAALLEWKVKAKNLLNNACGLNSEHYVAFVDNESPSFSGTNLDILKRLKAVILAAREDYEGGYLRSTRTLVQAEVFDSELEQAQALLDAGYKSASAVVAGVVLETSLRELCVHNNIQCGKLDKMNADLAKIGVFNKLWQKRVTAIADIRNSAAHGKSEELSEGDVQDMIRDVIRFVSELL